MRVRLASMSGEGQRVKKGKVAGWSKGGRKDEVKEDDRVRSRGRVR